MTRRRAFVDPLLPQPKATWLVVRDRTSVVLEAQELAPNIDLRLALAAARQARIAAGWACDEVGPAGSGFHCSKDAVRIYVGIERADPRRPGF
jgi:hypothetical protein